MTWCLDFARRDGGGGGWSDNPDPVQLYGVLVSSVLDSGSGVWFPYGYELTKRIGSEPRFKVVWRKPSHLKLNQIGRWHLTVATLESELTLEKVQPGCWHWWKHWKRGDKLGFSNRHMITDRAGRRNHALRYPISRELLTDRLLDCRWSVQPPLDGIS
jgi:hypothetical protein